VRTLPDTGLLRLIQNSSKLFKTGKDTSTDLALSQKADVQYITDDAIADKVTGVKKGRNRWLIF
jgi:hypothetical protein